MKNIFFVLLMIFTLTGCGKSAKKIENISTLSSVDKNSSNKQLSKINTISSNIDDQTPNIPTKQKVHKKVQRTLTLYIHGYEQKGYQRLGIFGQDSYDRSIQKIINFSNYSTTTNYKKEGDENIIAIATYYGNKAPSYWSEKDLNEYESMDDGIPRYSLIMAKYAKHMLQETNSTKLNIVSVSMGSLIARYMIEKDLEHLASDNRIKKWISFEGVISGNIGASEKTLASISGQKAPEVKQMSYDWIKSEFGTLRRSENPYMKDIKIAFESSTDDHLNKQIITYITGKANDGVQAVKDTYFRDDDNYPHTYFYQTHTSLSKAKAPWAYATIFLRSSKRVKITLDELSLHNLHEKSYLMPAEVVFASEVYSPTAMQKYKFNAPIDERVLKSHYLKLFKYKDEDRSKELGLKIFDSVVLDDESSLKIRITPYELDNEPFYSIYEFGKNRDLGSKEFEIPLKNGTYPIQTDEWSGSVSVEVIME